MVLRSKLRLVQMSRSHNVMSYLMRTTQVHDQLADIGEKMEDAKLVKISQIGKGFGMITSKKRLGRGLRKARRKVLRRTWLLSVR
jgi:hypothetical protein